MAPMKSPSPVHKSQEHSWIKAMEHNYMVWYLILLGTIMDPIKIPVWFLKV